MPTKNPCRHLFTDGHQCGSPALRDQPLCYYHQAARAALPAQPQPAAPAIPDPTDLHAVQLGLCHVLRLVSQEKIAHRTAALLLRTLAQASANLARIDRQQRHQAQRNSTARPAAGPVVQVVDHPTLGPLAPEPQSEVQTSPQQNQDFSPMQQKPTPIRVNPDDIMPPHVAAIPPTGPYTRVERAYLIHWNLRHDPVAKQKAIDAHLQEFKNWSEEGRAYDRQILVDRAQAKPPQPESQPESQLAS